MASKTCVQGKCKALATQHEDVASADDVKSVGFCDRHHGMYLSMIVGKKDDKPFAKADEFGHRCPTIHDAIKEGRPATTAEMDSTCDDCRGRLVMVCAKCSSWHHFRGEPKDQVCECGSTDFIGSTLVSERTLNPNRKAGK